MTMHFRSLHRPLERYSAALEDAGFLIEALREPAAPDRPDQSRARWRRIPMFLLLRAVRG